MRLQRRISICCIAVLFGVAAVAATQVKPTSEPSPEEVEWAQLEREARPTKSGVRWLPARTTKTDESTEQAEAMRSAREKAAVAVAKKWFAAMMQGDTDTLASLSAVPFAWDRKWIIETREGLAALNIEATKAKGSRAVPPVTVEVTGNESSIQAACFPVDRIVVRLSIEDEGIDVCIQPGKRFLVVGFSD